MSDQPSLQKREPKYWISYPGQFGLLLALFGTGVILLSMLMVPYLILSSGGELNNLSGFDTKNFSTKTMQIMQAVGSVLQFGLPAWLLALILKQKPVAFYKLNTRSSLKIIFLVSLLAITGTAFSDLLSRINEGIPLPKNLYDQFLAIEKAYYEQVSKIINLSSFGNFLLSLVIVAVLPAFFEELLFRGALQPILIGWTKNVFWGIFIASVLFSLLHLSFFGFLPRMFLGFALGYIFYYSGNLWMSILFHFLNNAFAVASFYFYNLNQSLDFAKATERMPLLYSVSGTLLFVFVFYLFYKQSVKEQVHLSK